MSTAPSAPNNIFNKIQKGNMNNDGMDVIFSQPGDRVVITTFPSQKSASTLK